MFNLKAEVTKNFLISGILSFIACFAIAHFVIPMPTNTVSNAIGNGISGFISGGVSAVIAVVTVSKKLLSTNAEH